MSDFRYFTTLIERANQGTFVGLRPTTDCQRKLAAWMKTQGVDKPLPMKDMHVTLILDREKDFDWFEHRYDPALVVEPDSFEIERFGEAKDVLVLSFDCPELHRKHMAARQEHGISWKFPEYRPHLTLSYEGQNQDLNINPPDFSLEFSSEYCTPFED